MSLGARFDPRVLATADALDDALVQAVSVAVAAAYPQEGCGLLVSPARGGALRWRACANIADRLHAEAPRYFPHTSADAFVIGAEVFAEVADHGEVVRAVVHSHCDAPAVFSRADRRDASRDGRSEASGPARDGVAQAVVEVRRGEAVRVALYGYDHYARRFERVRVVDLGA